MGDKIDGRCRTSNIGCKRRTYIRRKQSREAIISGLDLLLDITLRHLEIFAGILPPTHQPHSTALLNSLKDPFREDINRKKTSSFRHCPNHLTPSPPDPNLSNLVLFFGRQNSRFESHLKWFAKMWGGEGDILTT